MKVLIIGDSHTAALEKGKKLLAEKSKLPDGIKLDIRCLGNHRIMRTPFFIDRGDYAEICNDEYRKQYNFFPPLSLKHDMENVVYGLSGLLFPGSVISWLSKFAAPSQLVLNEIPVSNALLTQLVLDDCQYLLKFIDIILRTKQKLFVIEGPQFFRDAHISKNCRHQLIKYFNDYYRVIIKKELENRNIPVIALNPECYDEHGFMLEKYRHENINDKLHGNALFGELMLKKAIDFLLSEKYC
jgi:hypothetical protein